MHFGANGPGGKPPPNALVRRPSTILLRILLASPRALRRKPVLGLWLFGGASTIYGFRSWRPPKHLDRSSLLSVGDQLIDSLIEQHQFFQQLLATVAGPHGRLGSTVGRLEWLQAEALLRAEDLAVFQWYELSSAHDASLRGEAVVAHIEPLSAVGTSRVCHGTGRTGRLHGD